MKFCAGLNQYRRGKDLSWLSHKDFSHHFSQEVNSLLAFLGSKIHTRLRILIFSILRSTIKTDSLCSYLTNKLSTSMWEHQTSHSVSCSQGYKLMVPRRCTLSQSLFQLIPRQAASLMLFCLRISNLTKVKTLNVSGCKAFQTRSYAVKEPKNRSGSLYYRRILEIDFSRMVQL